MDESVVALTMSISLMKSGEFWEPIACHHYQPKLLCWEHWRNTGD
jgi:light-regulated signal transduction histidine kinase (bacteriophytochrome)